MAGAWRALDNQPAFSVDTMLLLTDGSVMCHENQTPNWHRLIPDAASDYGKGTWHQMASMPANAPASQGGPTNAPLYFASAVLADGRVVVAGGEYNGGTQVDLLAAEIYDPVADRWTSIATPHGWSNIGDAPSTVLQDGRWLLANIMSTETAVFDPASGHWSAGPNKQSVADEEGWTLLPDGSVLTVTVNDAPNAEKYISTSNQWVSASRTPPGHDLVSAASSEIGPGVLMADGRVFVVGATGHTAIYTPPANPSGPGTWTAGPDFPRDAAHNLLCAPDAPACLLPNGRVLCAVGHLNTSGQDSGYAGPPTRFFEFDGTHLTEVPQSPAGSGEMTFSCRLLLLPTGQVLLSTAGGELDLYTPDGAPNPSWAPRIHTAPPAVAIGGTYRISGVQFNGLSQASTYGDDAQMATNYPIARIRHDATGAISYLRTHHHSTMGVATGTRSVSTYISVPKIPLGPGTLTVIANGVPSPAVRINVLATAYQHVTYLSPDGHVHELYDALGAGHWAVNDLTHVAGAPPAAAGTGVTSWVDPAYQHVAYLVADGHVHELYDALGAGHWGHNDLTHVAGAPPAAAGSGVTSWIDPNYQHLVFVSADGHVHELYDALGAGHWSHNDLTAAAGAPSAAPGSAITSWIDPGYQHVAYVTADGHVHELYDALGAGHWSHNDLTAAAGAPSAAPGSAITSWIDPAYQHVAFLSPDGHVHELYDALGAGQWAVNDLTHAAGAPPAVAGSAITSWIDPANQHVVFLSADGHVHELYDALGAGRWAVNDLTHVAGAPPAAAGSGVTSWIDPAYQHVVFLSADGHVHELYDALGAGHWGHNDLTHVAGAPPAAAGSAITSWIDPAYQHVVFLSADGHVHELYDALGAGQWAVNDLTHAAGAPPAAAATAITSWIDPTYQHVVYLSADGHVHELYDALGAGHWAANDLIAVAGAQAASAGSAVTAWIDVG